MRAPKRVWKLFGLAGLAGVAATGAVLARGERQRRAYTPEDVRARLHERHAAAPALGEPQEVPADRARPARRPGARPARLRRRR